MFCIKCGTENSADSLFCIACGERLAASPAPQPTYAQPVQPQPNPAYQPYQPQPYQAYYAVAGSKLLRVSSILFIVSGSLSLLFEILMIAAYHINLDAGAIIGLLIACSAPIAVGIIGVRRFRDPSAGLFFIISGAVMLPLMIICVALMSGGMHASGYVISNFPGIASIVLPILFIVGGAKLKGYANRIAYPPYPNNYTGSFPGGNMS